MSNNSPIGLIRKQKVYSSAEEGRDSAKASMRSSERDLITQQTGQLLVTLGAMFVNLPPFNGHIAAGTGEMLISIGRKLKAQR